MSHHLRNMMEPFIMCLPTYLLMLSQPSRETGPYEAGDRFCEGKVLMICTNIERMSRPDTLRFRHDSGRGIWSESCFGYVPGVTFGHSSFVQQKFSAARELGVHGCQERCPCLTMANQHSVWIGAWSENCVMGPRVPTVRPSRNHRSQDRPAI